jgi:membrane fusion protein, copper/silver efflux system
VRIELDNPDMLLKPDMFADMDIHASRRVQALVIPTAAVIRTGRATKVFVQTAPGRFEPRDVRPGVSDGTDTEVLAGVREGERVVTSAQFLIDSESSLNEAAAKMVAPETQPVMQMKKAAPAPARTDMGGMPMQGTPHE